MQTKIKKFFKWFFGIIFVLLVLPITLFVVYTIYFLTITPPEYADKTSLQWQRTEPAKDYYRVQNNWLKKSESGLYEVYLEGKPYERGVAFAKLNNELQKYQEEVFVDQIREIVPSDKYLKFLGYFTRWFNKDLDQNIPMENRLEIAGYSKVIPKDFEYIAPNYERFLNYHAAHDLGHALQQYALVGCTSFSAWDSRTPDSSMIIGRNFDFYAGDRFDDIKMMMFVNPDSGMKFAMITWPGFFGCVSGMNEKGLTVTINAAKIDVPINSATPISILAREILQYAGTIDEAYAIAKQRKTFVSETIMIGSAADHSTALIEKSPTRLGLVRADSSQITCANHYQSEVFKDDSNNIHNIAESASMYRFNRLQQLLAGHDKIDVKAAAEILRDKGGINGEAVGYGNEMAMDQMQGHHAVIFKPQQRLMWVSTSPWQEGKMVCYDLNKFFSEQYKMGEKAEITVDSLEIAADPFMNSPQFAGYLYYRKTAKEIRAVISGKAKEPIRADVIQQFQKSNPDYYYTFALLGDYEAHLKHKSIAIEYYERALKLKINTMQDRWAIEEKIKKLKEKS